jgi:serine phosphatase RsbU (regulator of sigma subunit)
MLSVDPEHALDEERTAIAEGVVTQAALALDNARLYQQQKSFAEVIQESLLPTRLPQVPGLELGVLYRPATVGGAEAPQIGGDFYDFVELADGRVAFVVGDVTGKGVGAAADTAMTKYIFRALSREHPEPAAFLKNANDVVCDEITPGKFVTLFYGVVDPVNGTLTCGNAGHPEPKLLIGREGEPGGLTLQSLGMEGLALGIMAEQDYEQRTYDFPIGACVTTYTDGVVEARREGRLYGQYRLEKRLTEEAGASAPQVAFAVFQDCSAWAQDGLGDDIAIVVVKHVPIQEAAGE